MIACNKENPNGERIILFCDKKMFDNEMKWRFYHNAKNDWIVEMISIISGSVDWDSIWFDLKARIWLRI